MLIYSSETDYIQQRGMIMARYANNIYRCNYIGKACIYNGESIDFLRTNLRGGLAAVDNNYINEVIGRSSTQRILFRYLIMHELSAKLLLTI